MAVPVSEYLVTFRPLCVNGRGRSAIRAHGFPPFIDASCRREPDLQSRFPSITSICRTSHFAPRLRTGDRVAYMTVIGKWLADRTLHWRLVALLEVERILPTHQDADTWYRSQGEAPPSNCLVPTNPPLPLDQTALWVDKQVRTLALTNPGAALRAWDREYARRAQSEPAFVVCKTICSDLYSPPKITRADLEAVFGGIPGTRTPREYVAGEVSRLVRRVCSRRTASTDPSAAFTPPAAGASSDP